jgi:hypothetical protein
MTEEQVRVPKLRFPGFAVAWERILSKLEQLCSPSIFLTSSEMPFSVPNVDEQSGSARSSRRSTTSSPFISVSFRISVC